MNVIIIGCGQVGSHLACELQQAGHDVSVVDRDPALLDPADNLQMADFDGLRICGEPIDADVLRQAGIESCDAVIAASSSDSTNLMCAQIAKQLFGVGRVAVRVDDPLRGEAFSDMGLRTVCPTEFAVRALAAAIQEEEV